MAIARRACRLREGTAACLRAKVGSLARCRLEKRSKNGPAKKTRRREGEKKAEYDLSQHQQRKRRNHRPQPPAEEIVGGLERLFRIVKAACYREDPQRRKSQKKGTHHFFIKAQSSRYCKGRRRRTNNHTRGKTGFAAIRSCGQINSSHPRIKNRICILHPYFLVSPGRAGYSVSCATVEEEGDTRERACLRLCVKPQKRSTPLRFVISPPTYFPRSQTN